MCRGLSRAKVMVTIATKVCDGDRMSSKEQGSDDLKVPKYLCNINYKQKVINL